MTVRRTVPAALSETADRLHSAAIHLLRQLRRVDDQTGLSGPRLSALSVIVFAGPLTLRDLAAAEQVKPPTMTRLVDALEERGLVQRENDPSDARATLIRATPAGSVLLRKGRARRVQMLAERLATLRPEEIATLERALDALQRVLRGSTIRDR